MTCWRYGVKIFNFNLVSPKFWPEAVRGNYSNYDCGMKSKILIQRYRSALITDQKNHEISDIIRSQKAVKKRSVFW